jgi:hypothetical protein
MMDISLISSGISLLFKKTIISTYNSVNEPFYNIQDSQSTM